VFATVLYVTVTGACWRSVDRLFGVDDATCHRYFTTWAKAGVWTRLHHLALHHLALDQLGARGLLDWSRACVDSGQVRVKRGDKMPVPAR
jgi:transposase